MTIKFFPVAILDEQKHSQTMLETLCKAALQYVIDSPIGRRSANMKENDYPWFKNPPFPDDKEHMFVLNKLLYELIKHSSKKLPFFLRNGEIELNPQQISLLVGLYPVLIIDILLNKKENVLSEDILNVLYDEDIVGVIGSQERPLSSAGYCREKAFKALFFLTEKLAEERAPAFGRVSIAAGIDIDHIFLIVETKPNVQAPQSLSDFDPEDTFIVDPWMNKVYLLKEMVSIKEDLALVSLFRKETTSDIQAKYQSQDLLKNFKIKIIKELVPENLMLFTDARKVVEESQEQNNSAIFNPVNLNDFLLEVNKIQSKKNIAPSPPL